VCGIFRPANRAALKMGLHSERVASAELPEQADVRASLAAWRAEIEADMGGPDALTRLQRDTIDAYLRTATIASFLAERLIARGPLTPRGRAAAALAAFLSVTDRQHRLANALGLERRARQVGTLADVHRAVADAQRENEP
jgi:hypothetical protein